MMSYHKLATLYDFLMDDAPYEQWVDFTTHFIDKELNDKTEILDLGCGTGQVTWRLADKGYQVTGVDLSEDMLTEAAANANDKNLNIQWFKQDISELEGFSDYDLVISYCDVINYITEPDKLSKTFKHAFDSLNEEGIFLFDVHSVDYVKNQMVDQVFSEVYDDLAYIWFCSPGENEGEMIHELTFFIEDDDGYQRFDETHHQRTYPVSEYLKMLKDAGFRHIELYADFKTELITDFTNEQSADRLFFACRK